MSLGGEHTDLFIGGQWRAASAAGRIDVVNPATEEVWASVPDADAADVDAAVRAARAALPDWRGIGAAARAEVVLRFADELAARGEGMARVITAENGTPIAATSAAASHSAGILRYFATLADLVDAVDVRPFPNAPGSYTEVSREAVGVCALIAPWNFPLGLVMVKLAPALIAGCTVVIKPAAETPLDLRVLLEAAVAAGIPAGAINVITGGRETGSLLVQHPLVDKVAFTGSTEAGRIIAQQCGSLLRPVTLELGGKSAAILLDDVDLDYFGTMLNRTCLRNTGQTCYNSTRILAPRSRYGEIVELVAGVVASTKQGDPLELDTVYGPTVSARQRDRVEGYIALGRAEGATVATGGGRPAFDRGFFVQPTVFSDVDNRMRIAQEEIFGPVLVVIPFDDDSDAARIANDSQFGLGGSIFSADESRAAALARTIETGSIGVNFFGSNHAAPFGGWKDSGLGVEYGPEGLNAYLRLKSVHRRAG
ncbi:MAG TPA: aldehyde dehydrogenase family protein [Rhodoglobus sp.]|nr:aldehyde dehydrogenase family protein [Rhodoglobus sp.]HQA22549.1 aldehyde dehydrogenase family protein [Rhodoglobus sp.]